MPAVDISGFASAHSSLLHEADWCLRMTVMAGLVNNYNAVFGYATKISSFSLPIGIGSLSERNEHQVLMIDRGRRKGKEKEGERKGRRGGGKHGEKGSKEGKKEKLVGVRLKQHPVSIA